MEEDKVINKNIDETEEVVDEEETIDENEEMEDVEEDEEEDEEEITEESDEDNSEFYETRKIDFSNKNEVYQDFFDEKKKSKFVIFLVVIFILLLIGVFGYFIYINRDKIFNKLGNVVDNMDSLVDVENDDNDNSGGIIVSTSSDDVEEKILNVYQKGSDSVVVFTYKCKSKYCDIIVNNDSFILYDEDRVYHRDMTAYELEQINNTEKTPTKSELSFSGFEEVKSIYDEAYDEFNSDEKSILISILNKLYIVDNVLYKFGDFDDEIRKFELIDNEVLFCRASLGFLYNYKEKKLISFGEQGFSDCKKVDNFYLVLYYEGDGSAYYQVYNNLEQISFIALSNGYYINNDKLYYLAYDENNDTYSVQIINSKKEKIEYDNKDINPIHIFNGKLIYTDNEDVLCIKNILTNELIYKSELKLKNWLIFEYEEGFKIFESDNTVIEDEDFDKYRKSENIDDEVYNRVKKCIKENNDDCGFYWYGVGYMVTLDKDGKFISKDYYIQID